MSTHAAIDDLDPEWPRPRRPWILIAASLMLVVLVVAVWAKWSETRTEASQLRAEVKQVYVEAEALRTQANQFSQRVTALEHEVRALNVERADLLRRIEAAGGEKPPVKTRPVRKRPASVGAR